MHLPRRISLPLAVLAVVALLTLTGAESLVSAQQAAPTATPAPTATQSPAEIAGVQAPIDAGSELVRQVGIGGALLLLVFAAAFFIAASAAKKAGEGIGEYLYSTVLGRRLKRREQAVEQQARQREAAKQRSAEQDAGLSAYLDWVREELKHLPIIPIKSTERQAQLLIEETYVPLRAVKRGQIEGFQKLVRGDFDPAGEYRIRQEAFRALESSWGIYRLLSDVEALPNPTDSRQQRIIDATTTRCVLLVGDAGSGKTTTLQYGALLLALDRQQGWQQAARTLLDLHCATTQPLVPVYIRLTLVATYVREAYQRAKPEELPRLHGAPSALLLSWLDSYTQAQITTPDQPLPADLLSRRIAAGGCLVMLDGLDETGDARERDYIQRLIGSLVQDYPRNRYLVASRPFEDLRLAGFEERHLSPLNRDEIERLLRNWFGAVRQSSVRRASQDVDDQVGYLLRILDGNARLFEMATNPLLLTSMALLVHTGVGLPRERAELYNRLVYLLLETWRTQQVAGGVPGRADGRAARYGSEESVTGVQRRLQELAAWMMEHGRREIRLTDAQQVLRPVYQNLQQWNQEKADDYIAVFLESLALESGLIQRRDDGYSFAHFTLQEYLTARAYDARPDGVNNLLAHWKHPRWRETILLAVGHWVTGNTTEKAQLLLQKLLALGEEAANTDAATAVEAVILTGSALDDADASRVVELAPLRDTTGSRLREYAFNPEACPDPRHRNQAATIIDRLGLDDERPGLILEREDYWTQRIESGPFKILNNIDNQGNEDRFFTHYIYQSYALARYPVTNRQYLAFLNNLIQQGRYEEAQTRYPIGWLGYRYSPGLGNHPVVGVNWDDATAFAAWANLKILTPEQRASGETIRLPSEPEWERAAAYPVNLPITDVTYHWRKYPWSNRSETAIKAGNEESSSIPANLGISQIQSTSVVGIYPHGSAGCGAEELIGNVWEWCGSGYHAYPLPEDKELLYRPGNNFTYVVRGASWKHYFGKVNCATRAGRTQDAFSDTNGFRLARQFPSTLS